MPFGENITTAIIAICGALLSSIALGWNIYRQFTDKGRLSVHCFIGKIVPAMSDNRDYLFYRVTNIGRKPLWVTHIGGGFKDGDNLIMNPHGPMPKELKPGEYLSEYTPDLSILNKDLRFLGAWDSLGKIYKVDKKVLRMLKRKGQAKKV